ncbi:DUF2169 domain-containing protein [Sorangium sp. So ce1014]|uniref:DUF2169 family type VI secretion system accessory protein n=1 Tax=Sorangium sp. So ce1014 TaxID=3133326 RepID=UPI003F5E2271
MELINGTKLALDAIQALDKHGQPWLVVIAKGTYRIPAPNNVPELDKTQRGLLTKDVFEGEEGLSAPLFEADFAPIKPACDVIIKGSAHAPHGKPVTELDVGVMVGPIKKIVRVVGDRRWIRVLGGYKPSMPEPFVGMPLSYGRAFGGLFDGAAIGSDDPGDFLAHPANLVGCGYARGKLLGQIEGRAVPNLESPDSPIQDPKTLYAPVSLGPVARNWAPRLTFAGTYDQRWQDEIYPLLPPDFDERFYQCAPADQQMPYPRGGEEVTMLNLFAGGGLTRFCLPDLTLPMIALSRRRTQALLSPKVDTLAIDADVGTFDLVWRARMPLQRSVREVLVVAAGSICKRWWKSRVFGSGDCGCGGIETRDEDLAPVTEVLA